MGVCGEPPVAMRLARLAGLVLTATLLASLVASIIAHAEVPLVRGKVLVYAAPGADTDARAGVLLYLYNSTSVIIEDTGDDWAGVGHPVSLIISYEAASNTLTIFYGEDSGLDARICSSSPAARAVLLARLLVGGEHHLLLPLPQSLIENLDKIASMGHVNVVEEALTDKGAVEAVECTAPYNSTLLAINRTSYMGYQAVQVTLKDPRALDLEAPVKAYWRTDGVPLALTYGGQLALKLVAEDDLGLKKPTGPMQTSTTSNTPAQHPGKPRTTLHEERQHPKASIVLGAAAAIIAVAIAAALAKR